MNQETVTRKSRSKIQNLPPNWQVTDKVYTLDDLLDVYLEGKEDGKNDYQKILLGKLHANIDKATNIAEEFYNRINGKTPILKTILLKMEGITRFEALFLVDERSYLEDDFRNVYVEARKARNEAKNDTFSLNFSFLPVTSKVNTHCIEADGYFLRYGKK